MNRRLTAGIVLGVLFASFGPLMAEVGRESGRRLEAPEGSNHVRNETRQALRASGTSDLGTGWMDFFLLAWFQDQWYVADGRPYADELVDGRALLYRQICLDGHGCFEDRWTATFRDTSTLVVDPPTGFARLSVRMDSPGHAACELEATSVHQTPTVGGTFTTPYRGLDAVETSNRVQVALNGSCIGSATAIATASGEVWRREERTLSPMQQQRPGSIVTIAGVPAAGYEGDGGPARWAWLGHPSDVVVSGDRIFVADPNNNAIRRIDQDGRIHSHARVSAQSIATMPDGSLIASDWRRVVRVHDDGSTTPIAGGGSSLDDGPATAANLDGLQGIATDDEGRIYVADPNHGRVRVIERAGDIRTIGGNGSCSASVNDGAALESGLCHPSRVAVGTDGAVYVVERDAKRVRRISDDGQIKTMYAARNITISPPLVGGSWNFDATPEDVEVADDGRVYVSFGQMIARWNAGTWEHIAGKLTCDYEGDGGPATAAGMCGATGIDFDSDGRMLFADRLHHVVRRIHLAD